MDLDAVFQFVKESALEDAESHQLLRILQCLATIPPRYHSHSTVRGVNLLKGSGTVPTTSKLFGSHSWLYTQINKHANTHTYLDLKHTS